MAWPSRGGSVGETLEHGQQRSLMGEPTLAGRHAQALLVFSLQGAELVEGIGPPRGPCPAVPGALEGPDGLARRCGGPGIVAGARRSSCP